MSVEKVLLLVILSYFDQGCSKNSDSEIEPSTAEICFFSNFPDGSRELTIMNTDSSNKVTIFKDAPDPRYFPYFLFYNSINWSPDKRKIIFSSNRDTHDNDYFDVYTINSNGGNMKQISNPLKQDRAWPSFSSDGESFVYINSHDGGGDRGEIFISDISGLHAKAVTDSTTLPIYHNSEPKWSPDGITIYFTTRIKTEDTLLNIYSIKKDGTGLKRITQDDMREIYFLALSKDGTKLAFQSRTDNHIICIYTINADGTDLKQLTNFFSGIPVWSPNGDYIAFISHDNRTDIEGDDLYIIKADGSALKRITHYKKGYIPSIDWR